MRLQVKRMQVLVSPVQKLKNSHIFGIMVNNHTKEYEFETRKGASRGRALLIKQLKSKNIKVLFGEKIKINQ